MIDFVEYNDEKIRIKLPKQLQQQKSIRFFQGNLVRGKPETQVSVAIDLNLDEERYNSIKEEFLKPEIQNRPLGEKIERLGPCELGKDGLELLTSLVQPDTGFKFFFWSIIYNLGGSYIMMSISGGGSREDFENMARKIVNSLVII